MKMIIFAELSLNVTDNRGIEVSLMQPGPVKTELFTNPPKFALTAERCAFLMAVAIANKVDEAWIWKTAPVSGFIVRYFPYTIRWLMKKFMNEERVRAIQKMGH